MIEAVFFGTAALGVVIALIVQARRRKQFSAQTVLEAPVLQRRLIVTALVIGLAVMSALFAVMGASVEAWPFAAGATAVCAVLILSLVLTRKPLAIVRFDGKELSCGATRIDVTQPFVLHTAVKLPVVRRSHPWMFVTVEQGVSSLVFCFPWELQFGVTAESTGSLPSHMLDWRGAVILERLKTISSPSGSS